MTVWANEEITKRIAVIIVNQKMVFSTPLFVEKKDLFPPNELPKPVPFAWIRIKAVNKIERII